MNTYEEINKAWRSTCKILLGDEIGELDDFDEYLSLYLEPLAERKSAISGKLVTFSGNEICDRAKVISNSEINEYEKVMRSAKLDIDQIKDIDSIIEAVGEKFYYAGDVILGTSSNTLKSNRCMNSSFLYKSTDIYANCKFITHTQEARESEYCFCTTLCGENKFSIKGYDAWRQARCFETLRTYASADCYYVANMEGCNNCMFSFNQRNKSRMIGNIQLSAGEYQKIRDKLLEEIRETLRSKKTIIGILEIISWPEKAKPMANKINKKQEKGEPQKEVERAFQQVSETLFGKPLKGMIDYEQWLTRYSGKVMNVKSRISDKTVYIGPMACLAAMKNGAIEHEEALEQGKKQMPKEKLDGFSLANAAERLGEVKYTTPEAVYGEHLNVKECACYGSNSAHAFRSSFVYNCKYGAYTRYARNSEYAFGANLTMYSKYCINCHHSQNLTRCFEVSDSTNCADCYFCHNCEGLSNCMFCFNTKSKRYAIANVEIGPEKYNKIKGMVLADMIKKIERDKGLKLDIYSLGCKQ